mmetsp:Transcript_15196/g.23231  ORF Transcript_15196/g.23231 Transcript_15196/m.23231 type:complete len:120 (+) Transcript_15196:84-443(+)|eukprot:CAMPEP_0194753856 /NCGR_PEP_ID=MMETSP0323_2-20130528/7828_1 /TAXON_ID=2866 ORGANISM="Crypthecodinium cohnii, Strain Seligo" /NCGR_SAMPLE_ID=MMETSP0323_2 /ASSEMBLY_ACC=CAM_ASM_000346 /LENGTH=119 /DNA_ID=CAMNT_0039671999 /DNA_START=36 /DNA_END=395 /DNA_ORIENTATION=+
MKVISCFIALVVMSLLEVAAAAAGTGPLVHLKDGSQVDAEHLDEVHAGSFIVGVSGGAEVKKQLLADMLDELSWKPVRAYSDRMPMFAGHLTTEQIAWLLKRDEVKFVEEDGEVHTMVQ